MPCPECGQAVPLAPALDRDTVPDIGRDGMRSRTVWFISWHATGPGEVCATDYPSKRAAERAFDRATAGPGPALDLLEELLLADLVPEELEDRARRALAQAGRTA